MIFLSLNDQDGPMVEPIAIKLSTIYGMGKVFYDGWTVHPVEEMTDKMIKGLENCEFFFLR